MTETHDFEPGGSYGRCAACGRAKKSHAVPTTVTTANPDNAVTIPPNTTFETPFTPPSYTVQGTDAVNTAGALNLVLKRKLGMGMGTVEEEVDWPAEWPLPKIGESLMLSDRSAVVTDVRFDLDRKRIIVACK